MFKVELRQNCKECGTEIKRPSRYRTYCSKKCRDKNTNRRYGPYRNSNAKANELRGRYSPGKIKCKLCGRWYVQVGSHVFNKHKMFAREYREEMNLPVKKGIVPKWYRELKANQCLENGTVKNLKKGKKFWYKKGDIRARTQTFWKSHRRPADEYCEN